jgi:hypothetical protein
MRGEEGARELPRLKAEFHKRTSEKAVDIILSLGGIYVKLGQLLSTIGAGIFEDDYISACAMLQDGVPPRSFEEVKQIIEESVGVPIEELFCEFDAVPVGAASIAQAHRAVLVDGSPVIVKVQYPEVALHYKYDFDNLEFVVRWLFPENLQLVEGLRRRHEGELDFREEAAHLKECAANLAKHGFDRPGMARLPRVEESRLCTQHVLAMECLHGRSLKAVIEQEHEEMALALGLEGGAAELKRRTMSIVRAHFEQGTVMAVHDTVDTAAARTQPANEAARIHQPVDEAARASISSVLQNPAFLWLLPWAVGALRHYAALYSQTVVWVQEAAAMTRALLAMVGLGVWAPVWALQSGARSRADSTDPTRADIDTSGESVAQSVAQSVVHLHQGTGSTTSSETGSTTSSRNRQRSGEGAAVKVDLSSKLTDLVHVHGVQLLLDGVYNADPHPGNVIVLPDGTLGLIDYGMVGRLTLTDRLQLAQVVVALAEHDVAKVHALYTAAGYDARSHVGVPHNAAIVHRIATFHLDRIDLSAVDAAPTGSSAKNMQPMIAVLQNTLEHEVPDWVEQGRRLGGLLIGVANQAGRPISLSREWAPIARRLLAAHPEELAELQLQRARQRHRQRGNE